MSLATIWKETIHGPGLPYVLYFVTTSDEQAEELGISCAEENTGDGRVTLEPVLSFENRDEFASLHCAMKFAYIDLEKEKIEEERQGIVNEIRELEEAGRQAATHDEAHRIDEEVRCCYVRIDGLVKEKAFLKRGCC